MFCKATLLTVALAFVASATPISKQTGISIPIEKRSTLTNEDGTFNHAKAVRESVKTAKSVAFLPLLPQDNTDGS